MSLDAVEAALDRRLDPTAQAPLAIAVSGGGDSLALLHLAAAWARPYGRRLLVLHVDHRLQAQSGEWATRTETAARAAGADFQAMAWLGDKPATGLSAAARDARHRLLAQAARDAGAGVVLLGHTADDLAEAAIMRREGSNVGAPREWSPSPVWPEGRGVFLLRPLLTIRRQALREWLARRGVDWIDDPANQDQRSARARARVLVSQASYLEDQGPAAAPVWTGRAWEEIGGALSIGRVAIRQAPVAELAAACLCAAGGERPPRGRQVEALAARLAGEEVFTASLAGARIEAMLDKVVFAREAGEAARNALSQLELKAGETGVWDGRFELTADTDLTLRPLAGLTARLDQRQRATLASLPPAVRRSLPAAIDGRDQVSCLAAPGAPLRVKSLALRRLAAFCGAHRTEADLPAATSIFPSRGENAYG